MTIKDDLKEKKDLLKVKAEHKISQASGAFDNLSDRAFNATDNTQNALLRKIKAYPLTTLGVVGAIGFVLALLIK